MNNFSKQEIILIEKLGFADLASRLNDDPVSLYRIMVTKVFIHDIRT